MKTLDPGIVGRLEELPRSPAEAKRKGMRAYYTGKPCARGHLTWRRVDNTNCSLCTVERQRQRRAKEKTS